jgi:hypothetical protein
MKDFDFDGTALIDFDSEEATLDPDAFFVDDGITWTGASNTAITGLGHLVAKTVAVFADSLVQTSKVVAAGGGITIDTAATKVQAGLAYGAMMKTIDLELQTRAGTSQGKRKHISNAIVRVHESGTFKMGSSKTKMDTKTVTAGKVFTGDEDMTFPGGYQRHAYIYIDCTDPVPNTILSIMPSVDVNE